MANETWICTSDGRIFLPNVRPQDIYTSETGLIPFIKINETSSSETSSTNAIIFNTKQKNVSVNKKTAQDIYIGTNSGNKKIVAVFMGTENGNIQIW